MAAPCGARPRPGSPGSPRVAREAPTRPRKGRDGAPAPQAYSRGAARLPRRHEAGREAPGTMLGLDLIHRLGDDLFVLQVLEPDIDAVRRAAPRAAEFQGDEVTPTGVVRSVSHSSPFSEPRSAPALVPGGHPGAKRRGWPPGRRETPDREAQGQGWAVGPCRRHAERSGAPLMLRLSGVGGRGASRSEATRQEENRPAVRRAPLHPLRAPSSNVVRVPTTGTARVTRTHPQRWSGSLGKHAEGQQPHD